VATNVQQPYMAKRAQRKPVIAKDMDPRIRAPRVVFGMWYEYMPRGQPGKKKKPFNPEGGEADSNNAIRQCTDFWGDAGRGAE